MMRAFLFGSLSALLISACASYDGEIPIYERIQDQSASEITFAKTTLEALQARSIRENREYCGYIGLTPKGDYQASTPKRGRKGLCQPRDVPENFRILASYHTHGSFSVKFDSELPSSDDLFADIEEGIDGYVGTPGGRVWYTDAKAEKAILICSEGCIMTDPDFDPDDTPNVKAEYTLEDLIAFDE